jgi:hypothetical protein
MATLDNMGHKGVMAPIAMVVGLLPLVAADQVDMEAWGRPAMTEMPTLDETLCSAVRPSAINSSSSKNQAFLLDQGLEVLGLEAMMRVSREDMAHTKIAN